MATPQGAEAFAHGERLVQQTNAALVRLLKLEIEFATTMVATARLPHTPDETRARSLTRASKALAVVEQYLWRLRAELPVFDEITFNSERLRFEIEAAKLPAEPNC